jgi:serine O-acetyltransferase
LANVILFSLESPARLVIGPGLVIAHPYGTVIGAASIGANATFFQQVTVGAIEADFSYDSRKRPVIRDNVTLGAGSKILGGITVGDNAVVGANAVVIDDVPSDYVAVGVPARCRPRSN